MKELPLNDLILHAGQYNGAIQTMLQVEDAIVSKTRYKKDPEPQWHCHENMHIALVLNKAKSETRKQDYYVNSEGNVLFYHSGEFHKYTTYEPISYGSNIEIPASFVKKYELSEVVIQQNLQKKIDAKSLILSMQHEVLTNDPSAASNILSLLLELVSKPTIKQYSIPKWALRLDEILHEYWNEPLSLQQLSKILDIHPVTISKNFRLYFGFTLGEYRRKIKVEKSIALVKASQLSLSEVAYTCQFSDQSHFIRNFKKYTGFLPSDFRKF